MTSPTHADCIEAMDGTWPAARFINDAPWLLREGLGGGQRVSSASLAAPFSAPDIDRAEQAMQELGQPLIFQIRPEDEALDAALHARGYHVKDPVHIYAAPVENLIVGRPNPTTVFDAWPMLAISRALWAEAGIGPGRIAVMERAGTPKTVFLARHKDRPAAVAFAAIHKNIAMIHALEVAEFARKQGVGAKMMCAFGHWAQNNGARFTALAVTKENFAAKALYAKMGMSVVTSYHYRRK